MPRPPPVTKARFPERSITVLLQRGTRSAERGTAVKGRSPHNAHTFVPLSAFPLPRSRFQALLNHFADQVLDGEMDFLDPRRVVRGNDQHDVGQVLEPTARMPEKGLSAHPRGFATSEAPNPMGPSPPVQVRGRNSPAAAR